jgi:hypothetical protein
MMKTTNLSLQVSDEAAYVRLVSGLIPGNLTKTEKKIIILLLRQLRQGNTDVITQEMKEKVRIYLEISSQTMHNYWDKLKKKKVVEGNYKDYTFNQIFSRNIKLTVLFNESGKG